MQQSPLHTGQVEPPQTLDASWFPWAKFYTSGAWHKQLSELPHSAISQTLCRMLWADVHLEILRQCMESGIYQYILVLLLRYIQDIYLYIPLYTIFIHLILCYWLWWYMKAVIFYATVYGGIGSLFCCFFLNMTGCTAMLIDIFSYQDLSSPPGF